MQILIMTNGSYGEHAWYRGKLGGYSRIICADGAAGTAVRIGAEPHLVVGDMDSIDPGDRVKLVRAGARFLVFPPEKDLTDTQIAYELAMKEGAEQVTVWGAVGSRLDHTLSTLCTAFSLVERGIDVCFSSPELDIHLVRGSITLQAVAGQTVSVVVLGDRATGVTLDGLKYPLSDAVMEGAWQFGVSNVAAVKNPSVRVETGRVAVFHWRALPE
jgi:thiamine pyrophosphokinase